VASFGNSHVHPPSRPVWKDLTSSSAFALEDMPMTSPTWRALGQIVLVYFAVGGAAVTAQNTQPGRATFAEMIALPDLLPSPASV
jgi:hypothetical protein